MADDEKTFELAGQNVPVGQDELHRKSIEGFVCDKCGGPVVNWSWHAHSTGMMLLVCATRCGGIAKEIQ